MPQISLQCACAKVRGLTDEVNAKTGTRLVCCCADCQSFAKFLGEQDRVLDQYGGTDIFQMPISHIHISEGQAYIACMRLSNKGLYRWYTKCCNTPIGNSMGAGVAFMGVIHSFMRHGTSRDTDLGNSHGHIQTESALKPVPDKLKGPAFKLVMRSLSMLLMWKLKGLNTPSDFFDEQCHPIDKPTVWQPNN